MENNILFFILVGFIAQTIDGALGMAGGIITNSILLTFGISPAAASASVHAAKVVTTLVSGVSHWRFGNVDMKLLKRLVIPGMIGGIIGAFLLTRVPEDIIRPVVSVYLILMGVVILLKVLRGQEAQKIRFPIIPLGLAGGFFDAIGGGGWGPIVTTTLVARGKKPRFAIGTVNLAEFFVTVVQSVTFIMTIGITHWVIILGLVIGGGIAAPLAALLTSRLPRRHLSNLVGLLIIALSVRTIFVAFR